MEPVRLDAIINWLLDTAADLVPAESLEEALERYLDRLLDRLEAEQGSVMLRQDDELAIMAARGLSTEIKPGMRVDLAAGPAGAAVVEGTPRLVHGALPSPRAHLRPTSAMIIPIRARQRIVGVLNIGRVSRGEPFTPEDLQTTSVLATQLAWILTNFELMSKLWRLVITDELSGLYNRRYFRLRLHEEINRCLRNDEPMSLAMMDLDGFKELNGQHGHLVGDEVLAQVCAVVRRNLRAVDVASRYGGDEISVILPKTAASAAFVIIERLQRAVASEVFVGQNGIPVQLSLCAGIAQCPGDGNEPEALIRKADGALLEAKRAGAGRVLIAE